VRTWEKERHDLARNDRQRAAQCLSLAERAERDDDKATWVELAGKWQRLAEEADRNHVTQQAQQPQSLDDERRMRASQLRACIHLPN
jgi:hypothetical protein